MLVNSSRSAETPKTKLVPTLLPETQTPERPISWALSHMLRPDLAEAYSDQLPEREINRESTFIVPTPREIKAFLDTEVVGNDAAKKRLALAVHNHYKVLGHQFPVSETSRILDNFFAIKRGKDAPASALVRGITMAIRQNKIDRSTSNPLYAELNVALRAGIEGGVISPRPLKLRGEKTKTVRKRGEAHNERARRFVDAVCRANKRIRENPIKSDKHNLLIIGPTGSGKTHLLRIVSKHMGVPFLPLDMTQFSVTGYSGSSIHEIPEMLLERAGGKKSLAELGIVFCDEVDKKATAPTRSDRDVVGEDVQQSLLTLLEDYVDPNTGFDMANVLFVFGGTFAGIDKLVRKRLGGSRIGFQASQNGQAHLTDDEVLSCVEPQDLVKYGMTRELVGRIQLTYTDPPSPERLWRILVEPKTSALTKMQELLLIDGVTLTVTDDGARRIAEIAYAQGTGARALRDVLNELLVDIQFEAPELHAEEHISEITLDRERVEEIWSRSARKL